MSGFYRIVTLVFQETDRARYFDGSPLRPAAASDEVCMSTGILLLLLPPLLLLMMSMLSSMLLSHLVCSCCSSC